MEEKKQPMEQEQAPAEDMAQENMESPMSPQEGPGGSGGALIALVVIVLIILAGAFFIFGDKLPGEPKTDAELDEQFDATGVEAQAELEAINSTSDSNALADLEADINSSDLSDLDAELDAIDQELGL